MDRSCCHEPALHFYRPGGPDDVDRPAGDPAHTNPTFSPTLISRWSPLRKQPAWRSTLIIAVSIRSRSSRPRVLSALGETVNALLFRREGLQVEAAGDFGKVTLAPVISAGLRLRGLK